VENLQKLFASMIMANRKYVDPTSVLKSLTDDFGQFLRVGEQKDLGEFNLNLLERIEEGLGERKQEAAESVQVDDLQTYQLLTQTQSSFDVSLDIDSAAINAGLELMKVSSTDS
jgi:hypothetical protein